MSLGFIEQSAWAWREKERPFPAVWKMVPVLTKQCEANWGEKGGHVLKLQLNLGMFIVQWIEHIYKYVKTNTIFMFFRIMDGFLVLIPDFR